MQAGFLCVQDYYIIDTCAFLREYLPTEHLLTVLFWIRQEKPRPKFLDFDNGEDKL